MPPTNAIHAIRRTFMERRPLLMSIAVLGWSVKYLVSLGLAHTNGPEMYGVITAALAVGAAGANLALLRSRRPQVILAAVLLVIWAVIAVGGVAGTVAHVVGPVPGHGPMDLRPRPTLAPLVFTVLGVVGAAALTLGQRAAIRRSRNVREG